jgi:hypothetical protein
LGGVCGNTYPLQKYKNMSNKTNDICFETKKEAEEEIKHAEIIEKELSGFQGDE